MATNLILLALACAGPCPPEAAALVDSAWTAYRAQAIAVAGEQFARADRLCDHNLDAKVGLGFVRLRLDKVADADSLFRLVTAADSSNGDAWDGLTLTRWRSGDRAGALAAGRRALALHPKNDATRSILAQIDPDWDRPAIQQPRRRAALRVDARVRGDFFEVPGPKGSWRRFYVNGINMGVALPGKFPSEFPPDSATYAGWFGLIAGMHANTLRLYTILPPSFYRALRAWNVAHRDRSLWLIHGVWTELPPEHDFDDAEWKGEFRQEMRRVVDLLHGHAEIPVRPGHAGGRYDADLSPWTLGYIIGREWEPYAVKDFDAKHPARAFRGRYLATRGSAPAMDSWMAEACDYLLGYEVERYNTIRPIAYTNWPTLDPLRHITESNGDEESAWRRKVGRPTPRDPIEYENDAIGLDAMLVRATAVNPAGWFASYHAYPYYPDFMLYDPEYAKSSSSEGRSNYFGYLRELKRHHAGVPLLLSEYGVPSSRGLAHLQPQGWHHGGHDETAMARIDARLTREIRESGAAGGIIFAWIDEWFKKNWIVIDYEIPLENTRQWHNVMDAEQNYGILGMYAGDSATTPELGGEPRRWRALAPIATPANPMLPNRPSALRVGSDESYLYLAAEFPALAGMPFPWGERRIMLALDTYRADLGQRTLPGGVVRGDIGFEFVAVIRDSSDAELRVTPGYTPYVGADRIMDGDDYGRFSRRPITTVPADDGRFDSMFVITNRSRFTRDGRFIPAQGINRGRLRFGRAAESSLSDWYWDREAGLFELRLPWNLLNVSDPSTGTLIYETQEGDQIGTAHSDGLRIGLAVIDGSGHVVSALPELNPKGEWEARSFASWQWPTWTVPRYHQRLKPVYDSLKAVWAR
jgi:hypothetical protein